jgi:cytosine/adenosine deaminase-related metal-dependent hydrolase
MRILDQRKQKGLKNIILYLTKEEAEEMRDALDSMIAQQDKPMHTHINEDEYEHEVTIAIYNANNLTDFDERSKQLILLDE